MITRYFSGSSYKGVIINWSKSMYTKLRNYVDAVSTDPNVYITFKLRGCKLADAVPHYSPC